jgi:hypothetical protein
MSRKNSTSKDSSRPTAMMPEGEQPIEEFASLLSKAMNHPEMPTDLYNEIGDWVSDNFHNGLNLSEPWVIRRALERSQAKGGRADV